MCVLLNYNCTVIIFLITIYYKDYLYTVVTALWLWDEVAILLIERALRFMSIPLQLKTLHLIFMFLSVFSVL